MSSVPRSHLIMMIGLLLLLTAIVAPRLNDPIWTDEQRTLYYIGAPPVNGPTTLGETIDRLAENHWQSPAYFILLWGWWRVMGSQIFILRLLSLYIGLVTVAAVYTRLRRRAASPAIGLYAATLMSLSAFYINFLHDMRAYSLLVLLTLFTISAYRWVRQVYRGWHWGVCLLALGTTLLLYTHFFTIFPLATLGILTLLEKRRTVVFWPLIGAFAVAGLAFTPWLPVLLAGVSDATTDPRAIANMGFWRGLSDTLHFFSNGSVVFLLGLITLALWTTPATRRIAGFGLVLTYLLLWGVTRFVQSFTEVKYVLYFWPILASLAAVGVSKLHERNIHPAWVLLLWSLGFVGSLTSAAEQNRIHPWSTPPLDAITASLTDLTTNDDALLFLALPSTRPPDIEPAMIGYYAHGLPLRRTEIIRDTYATTDTFWQSQITAGADGADRVLISYETTPLPTWRIGPLQDFIMPMLGYAACGTIVSQDNFTVTVFGRPRAQMDYRFELDDEAMVELMPYTQPTLDAADNLHVSLTWDFPEETTARPTAHSVGVHLETATGTFLRQVDTGITAAGSGCVHHIIPVDDLPPGDYVVKATVYRWQTGERLPSTNPAPDSERPVIGTFTIHRPPSPQFPRLPTAP
jgi:hypothetical protein